MGTSFEDKTGLDKDVLDTLHVAGDRMRRVVAMPEQDGS